LKLFVEFLELGKREPFLDRLRAIAWSSWLRLPGAGSSTRPCETNRQDRCQHHFQLRFEHRLSASFLLVDAQRPDTGLLDGKWWNFLYSPL
jgi:hypothetical protein